MNSCMTWRALSMSPTAAFTTCDTPSIVMPDFENASSKPLRVSKMLRRAFASVGPTALPCSTIDSVSCFVSSSTRCTLRDHAS